MHEAEHDCFIAQGIHIKWPRRCPDHPLALIQIKRNALAGPVWVSTYPCSNHPCIVGWGGRVILYPSFCSLLSRKCQRGVLYSYVILSCFGWVSIHCHHTELIKTTANSLGVPVCPSLLPYGRRSSPAGSKGWFFLNECREFSCTMALM